MPTHRRPFAPAFSIVAVLLTGCALPQGAGMPSQILAGAEAPDATFDVVQVNRDTLSRLKTWPTPGSHIRTSGWLPRGTGRKEEMIAPSDRLDVTLWSNEENGLLSVSGQKSTILQQLKVSQDGTIFLPYAGSVKIAGMTIDEARQAIQDKLATIAPTAQVTLVHSLGRDNAVQVLGGLGKNGIVGLPDRDFSVLDLIGSSEGIPNQMVNPQVNVTRGDKLYSIAFSELIQNPALDAILQPGDRIYVQSDQRYFMTLGAAQRETQFPFPRSRISVLDAVSLMGGLIDVTADPKAVLILRNYPESTLRTDGSGPSKQRTIFVFDLISADGLFSAGEFQVEDRDVVLVAQSPLLTNSAILEFLKSMTGLGLNLQNIQLNQNKI